MKDIIEYGNIDLALEMEIFWYNKLLKLEENEENYFLGFKSHKKSFWEAGVNRSSLTNLTSHPNKKNIVFVLSNPVLLGHTEVMLLIIKGWVKKYPDLNIYVAGFNKFESTLKGRLEELNIKMIESIPENSLSSAIQKLKELIQAENIYCAIWVSLPAQISYIFGVRLALKQIIWALKFHPVYLGAGVMHIASSKFTNEKYSYINNDKWLSFTPPLSVESIPTDLAIFNEALEKYPKKLIFGTLAREEKFNSPIFIDAIIAILKECKDSIYLFTGRKPNQFLIDAAKKNCISNQLYFIGWVDTNLYSAIIDVFLESFPFGCGVTSMQALNHGTHVVSMWSEDTIPRWYFKNVEDSFAFKPGWNVVLNYIDYVESAIKLYKNYKEEGILKKNFYTSSTLKEEKKPEIFLELILNN